MRVSVSARAFVAIVFPRRRVFFKPFVKRLNAVGWPGDTDHTNIALMWNGLPYTLY